MMTSTSKSIESFISARRTAYGAGYTTFLLGIIQIGACLGNMSTIGGPRMDQYAQKITETVETLCNITADNSGWEVQMVMDDLSALVDLFDSTDGMAMQ